MFPTLSKQAVIWQRYKFKHIRFEYEPTVNEFATAGTTGKVIFQVNIDPADGAPTTKAAAYATDKQLMNSDLPSRKFSVTVPSKYLQPSGQNWHLVRQGALPGGADIHLYDVANLFISTTGTVDNTTKLGELHVYYGVQFENLLNSALEAAPINNQVAQGQTAAGGQTLTTTVGAGMTTVLGPNGLGATSSNGQITLPVGNYVVHWSLLVQDSVNEDLVVVADLQTNSGSLYTSTKKPTAHTSGLAATEDIFMSGSMYFVITGTNTLIELLVTATAVAGVITANATMLVVAV